MEYELTNQRTAFVEDLAELVSEATTLKQLRELTLDLITKWQVPQEEEEESSSGHPVNGQWKEEV